MQFQSIRYMEWTKKLKGCRIDLRPSSIERVSLASLDLDLSDLEISGGNSYGYPPLLNAIAARYGVGSENIISTLGTSQGLFLACAALLSPGDNVLVEKPAYEPLLAVPAALGAGRRRFERRFHENFRVDRESFLKEMDGSIRIVLLTNLHNPSGVGMTESDFQMIIQTARSENAYVLVDEVYLDFLDNPLKRSAFAFGKNIIVVSSLTKVYGLAGLRCGWMLAPLPIIERVKRIIDSIHVEGVFLGEQVALKCFDRLARIREAAQPQIAQNFFLLKEFILADDRLSWVEPVGGVIAFPRIVSGPDGDSLAAHLRDQYAVCVVPGSFFECPAHFRIGLGGDPQVFQEGLSCLSRALDDLSL